MQLRLFRRCAFADLAPVRLNQVKIKFGDFADGDVKFCDLRCVGFPRMLKSLCEKGLREFKFFSMIHNVAQAAVTSTGSVHASAARTPPKAKNNNAASGRSISRILSCGLPRMCDHLSGRRVAAPLDAAYPGLTQPPRDWIRMKTSRLPPSADGFVPAWPCSRRGLPDALHYCKRRWSLTPPFHHYPAQARGCLFLWPLSGRFAPYGGFPAPGTIRRRALWSADFPRWRQRATAIAQPT